MFSSKKSLPSPHSFESQPLGSKPFDDESAVAAGHSRQSNHGVDRAAYSRNITVLLLNDTPLTRECLSVSLNLCDRGLRVLTAASVADVETMLRSDTAPEIDVVLCHLGGATPLAPRSLSALHQLLGILAQIPLIVLSDYEEPDAILETFRLGVRGYIPTSVGLTMALEAIRLVDAGGTFLPASFLERLIQAPLPPARTPEQMPEADVPPCRPACADDHLNGLTPRQLSVLKCMREGKANKVIAHELDMCESTVKVHVRNILKKLGATNRTQAVYLTFNRSSA
ncbi:MAG TPA: response regulator transcription factor [Azospirillum sp.]|nr:response regulator transcription factor [Azospirillum sp.]